MMEPQNDQHPTNARIPRSRRPAPSCHLEIENPKRGLGFYESARKMNLLGSIFISSEFVA
jgi:hypothetical protein